MKARWMKAAALPMAAIMFSVGAASAETFTYSSYAGPKHAVNELALPFWFEDVKELTGGEVEWQLVTGGQLMSGRETVAGVSDGIADAGMVVPSYTPSAIPSIATLYTTLVFGDDVVAAGGAVLETLMLDCPACKEDLKRNNVVAFAGYSATPFMLMCTRPVTSMAELRGMKVRASGAGVNMMQMAGATPVAMDPADGATAMQRGTIDCVLGSVNWLQSYGYQDVAKHVLNFPLGMMGPVITGFMNRDRWEALSDEHKQAFIDAAPALDARGVIDAYYGVDQEVLASVAERGVQLHEPTSDDLNELVEKYQVEARETTVREMQGLGLEDPGAIIDAYQRNLEKWRELSSEIGYDVDKFAAALQREIYDKIDINDL